MHTVVVGVVEEPFRTLIFEALSVATRPETLRTTSCGVHKDPVFLRRTVEVWSDRINRISWIRICWIIRFNGVYGLLLVGGGWLWGTVVAVGGRNRRFGTHWILEAIDDRSVLLIVVTTVSRRSMHICTI